MSLRKRTPKSRNETSVRLAYASLLPKFQRRAPPVLQSQPEKAVNQASLQGFYWRVFERASRVPCFFFEKNWATCHLL